MTQALLAPTTVAAGSLIYRPDIDGLRAVAVLAAVLFHAFSSALPGGFAGVDVFFVISGYLIMGILLAHLRAAQFPPGRFYARRVRRIFPALVVMLLATYAMGWFSLYGDEYHELGRHIAAGAGFVSNWASWTEAGYFDQAAEAKPLLHLRSLGVADMTAAQLRAIGYRQHVARMVPFTAVVDELRRRHPALLVYDPPACCATAAATSAR